MKTPQDAVNAYVRGDLNLTDLFVQLGRCLAELDEHGFFASLPKDLRDELVQGTDGFPDMEEGWSRMRVFAISTRVGPVSREQVASEASEGAEEKVRKTQSEAALDLEFLGQASLLRDIFGPLPFRRPRFASRWRTPLVLLLAQAAYDERIAPYPLRPGWLVLDRDRLRVLADALEEAGCDERKILDHLRGPEGHTRGCWCIDLVLGKS